MHDDAIQDPPTVDASGASLQSLPQRVTFRPSPTHIDDRGTVCEMFDTRWPWHPDALVFVYMFTLRPGMVKGWGLHKLHEDRYFVVSGEMAIVMYDVRDGSPTKHQVSKVVLSHYNRGLLNIPAGIWHANWNVGSTDCVVVNHPTKPYEHDNPDKYRLPIDTTEIPFTFPKGVNGW